MMRSVNRIAQVGVGNWNVCSDFEVLNDNNLYKNQIRLMLVELIDYVYKYKV